MRRKLSGGRNKQTGDVAAVATRAITLDWQLSTTAVTVNAQTVIGSNLVSKVAADMVDI